MDLDPSPLPASISATVVVAIDDAHEGRFQPGQSVPRGRLCLALPKER